MINARNPKGNDFFNVFPVPVVMPFLLGTVSISDPWIPAIRSPYIIIKGSVSDLISR